MSIAIDYVLDWRARLASRLFTQFRPSITWNLFVDFLGALAQDWEDAAQTLLSRLDIDGSSGVQLDMIGRIVGQPRTVADDPTYRLILKARVLANRSEGTPENLYKIFNALLGAVGFRYELAGYKWFVFYVKGAITGAQGLLGVDFLGDSKEAGAHAILQWQYDTDANTFCFAGGTGKGFGDSTNPNIGGKFSSARAA